MLPVASSMSHSSHKPHEANVSKQANTMKIVIFETGHTCDMTLEII